MRTYSRVGLISAAAFYGLVASQTLAYPTQPDPRHTLTAAVDGSTLSITDTQSGWLALHFLPDGDSGKPAAFVREFMRGAPKLAGVRHVFVRTGAPDRVRAWAEKFDDPSAIYVDADGALAAELNVGIGSQAGAKTPVTVVLGAQAVELFRRVGADAEDFVAFDAFARTLGERTSLPAIGEYNVPRDTRLAVEGYDVVSYLDSNKAANGKPEYPSTYRGVTYRFVSEHNRKQFADHPEKYLPTYGGWCASAMGDKGTKVEIDPTNFKVKDGRLFLFYKSLFGDALKDWNKREKEWEPAADANWKKVTGEDPIKPASGLVPEPTQERR